MAGSDSKTWPADLAGLLPDCLGNRQADRPVEVPVGHPVHARCRLGSASRPVALGFPEYVVLGA